MSTATRAVLVGGPRDGEYVMVPPGETVVRCIESGSLANQSAPTRHGSYRIVRAANGVPVTGDDGCVRFSFAGWR